MNRQEEDPKQRPHKNEVTREDPTLSDGSLPQSSKTSGTFDPEKITLAENNVIQKYSLSQESAEFLGIEFLGIIKEQLPPGIVLEQPRFLGANRDTYGETAEICLAVSFELRDQGFQNEELYHLPDPSVFEPQFDGDDFGQESEEDNPARGDSNAVIYEVEDADPDNPNAPRRVRQRAPKKDSNNVFVGTLPSLSGNMDEIFEPTNTQARVILVSHGRSIDLEVVFGAAEALPDTIRERLIASSPIETMAQLAEKPETAEQMFFRLQAQGEELYDILPKMQEAGFSEDSILPFLSAKANRSTEQAQTPQTSASDFPVEDVSHPFSYARLELEKWSKRYCENPDFPYPSMQANIRAIKPSDSGSELIRLTLEVPKGFNEYAIHKLTLMPILQQGKLDFKIQNREIMNFADYLSERRIELNTPGAG